MPLNEQYLTFIQKLWLNPSGLLLNELEQCLDEGKDIGAKLIAKIKLIASSKDSGNQHAIEEQAGKLLEALQTSPNKQDYGYCEPSEWEEVSAEFRIKKYSQSIDVVDIKKMSNKILGGWLGKCIGCLLGRPIEGWRRSKIISFLIDTNNFPATQYLFENVDDLQRKKYVSTDKTRCEKIHGMPEDDDVNYLLVSLKLIEKYGFDFTPEQVAQNWLDNLSIFNLFTAERVAYNNFLNGLLPPETAMFHNPYREWIGAQIRGDFFGYICPGNPGMAAKLAWKDASVSHIKNGIYGEMWVASMVSIAGASIEMKKIIQEALAFTPQRSRFYEAISKVIKWFDVKLTAENVIEKIHERYCESKIHDWCHVLPNAMIVAVSLLWGNGDFNRSLNIALTAGFDTDCNAATVGSILGYAYGADNISDRWKKPLGDTIYSGVNGMSKVKISDMALRTFRLIACC